VTRLEIKESAQSDLNEIFDFSVERFGKDVAVTYLTGIRLAFRRILDFPEMGVISSETKQEMRVAHYRSHRIFYRLSKKRVEIVRVLHQAMDVPSRLG
jgi:toxin ParE1/3/4